MKKLFKIETIWYNSAGRPVYVAASDSIVALQLGLNYIKSFNASQRKGDYPPSEWKFDSFKEIGEVVSET